MSHPAKDMASKPSGKLDAQLAALDRSHTNRQNALAPPGSYTTSSPQFMKRGPVPSPKPPKR